ncbi:hypothetical protein RRG08_034810 [Elysia crispata]|uniref:Secreted protein n=1 Tax=Elysia crispata TaxID=231223 RepID=A0AAE1E0X4_9GAST|nr:hypothetical protein RRG08_034810 [Elysia crispata]
MNPRVCDKLCVCLILAAVELGRVPARQRCVWGVRRFMNERRRTKADRAQPQWRSFPSSTLIQLGTHEGRESSRDFMLDEVHLMLLGSYSSLFGLRIWFCTKRKFYHKQISILKLIKVQKG